MEDEGQFTGRIRDKPEGAMSVVDNGYAFFCGLVRGACV